MSSPPLILASASPRRAELLRQIGLEFRIVPSEAPEAHDAWLSAGEVAQINASRKAGVVSEKHPDAITVGVDTVVVLGRRILGKPRTLAEAGKMLWRLLGRTHQLVTGVCLIHPRARRRKVFFEQTDVTFRRLTRAQIRHYHRQVNPLDKAGGYGIQEKGDVLVESLSGSFTNVIGLPLERFEAELDDFQRRG